MNKYKVKHLKNNSKIYWNINKIIVFIEINTNQFKALA